MTELGTPKIISKALWGGQAPPKKTEQPSIGTCSPLGPVLLLFRGFKPLLEVLYVGGWGCRSLPPALADPSYLSPQTPPFLASGLGVTRGPNGAIAKTKPGGCRGCFGRGGASGGFSAFFPTKCFLRHAGLF